MFFYISFVRFFVLVDLLVLVCQSWFVFVCLPTCLLFDWSLAFDWRCRLSNVSEQGKLAGRNCNISCVCLLAVRFCHALRGARA